MRRAMASVQTIDTMAFCKAAGGRIRFPSGDTSGIAWRVFTKGIDRESARKQIKVEGNFDTRSSGFSES